MNNLNRHLLNVADRMLQAERLAVAMQSRATGAMRTAIEIDREFAEMRRIRAEREGKQ